MPLTTNSSFMYSSKDKGFFSKQKEMLVLRKSSIQSNKEINQDLMIAYKQLYKHQSQYQTKVKQSITLKQPEKKIVQDRKVNKLFGMNVSKLEEHLANRPHTTGNS